MLLTETSDVPNIKQRWNQLCLCVASWGEEEISNLKLKDISFCLVYTEQLWCFNTYFGDRQDSGQVQQMIRNIMGEQLEMQSSLSLLAHDSKQWATSAADKINFIVTQGQHWSVCLQDTANTLSHTFLSDGLESITDYHFHCGFDLSLYSMQRVPSRKINKEVNTGKVLVSEFQMFHFQIYNLTKMIPVKPTKVLNESNFLLDFEIKNINELFFFKYCPWWRLCYLTAAFIWSFCKTFSCSSLSTGWTLNV